MNEYKLTSWPAGYNGPKVFEAQTATHATHKAARAWREQLGLKLPLTFLGHYFIARNADPQPPGKQPEIPPALLEAHWRAQAAAREALEVLYDGKEPARKHLLRPPHKLPSTL